jgi:Mg-chelatase subunit ChlD
MFKFIVQTYSQFGTSRIIKAALLVSLVVVSAILAEAKSQPVPGAPATVKKHDLVKILPVTQPRIDVVFALDTTGSMSGLLDGAKQKIWTIVNQMANANETPLIRVGLVGYRDRGDLYITKRFDLTQDIDALYEHLQNFSAGGGGDGPESVNQALHEAVMQMSWSQGNDVYKVVFLVGDAPPHMDYQDDVPYKASVKLAAEKGIVINTIQCGSGREAAKVFANIAKLAQGEYARVSQDGAMVAIHTPMDEELSELNVMLSKTVIAYGREEEKRELRSKMARSLAAAPSSIASRLSYFAKASPALVNSGRKDLIGALDADEVVLEKLEKSELPAEMLAMSPGERESYVKEKARTRFEIKAKIKALAESRDTYIEEESKKRLADGKADSFDDRLLGTIRTQAAKKGILY